MYDRRYWREFAVWFVAYVALMLGAARILKGLPDDSPWRVALVLPVLLVLLAAIWIELRMVRRFDEMQRMIYLEATFASSLLAMLVTASGWLFEEMAGAPRISPLWVMAALGGGFLLGYLNARRRYA